MPDQKHGTPDRIDRLVRRARWVITVERLWPPAVLGLGVVMAFIALSWLGLWVAAPRPIRMLGVGCLVAGLAAAAVLAYRAGRPTREDALARLDRDSGLSHRPVSTAEDQLANPGHDPTTRALWDLHRRRLDAVMRCIRVAAPSPRLAERDPFALRALAVLALVAAGFVAGPAKEGLVAAAFDWRGGAGGSGPGFRMDAWIDPPAYTGKPPLVLFAQEQADHPVQSVTVPANSVVVVRSSGDGPLEIKTEGALKPVEPSAQPKQTGTPAHPTDRAGERDAAPAVKPATAEKRFKLSGNAHLGVAHDGSPLGSVAIEATPDLPPTIEMVGKAQSSARGTLTLHYKIGDDYGVVGAEASFSDPILRGRPIVRALVPPPKLSLSLPPTSGGLGNGQTAADMADHPWAGADVTVVLSARDEGGNVGLSTPARITLPARSFTKPLARALVEQRQNLLFDPDHRDRVGTALDALMIAPDRFGTTDSVYLGLYTARRQLEAARTDQDLIALSDYLWAMALRIEDGDLSQAQRDLRAAEQALREALRRGAPPDEIKKLTDALREQMNKMLAEMMRQNKSAKADRQANPNAKAVTPKDLDQMMRRMEQMAQSGDTAEAQRMLDELQNVLENLKTAQGGAPDQASREMNRQMSELDQMTRDQQDLRNKTFKQGKGARRAERNLDDPEADEPPLPGAGDDMMDEDGSDSTRDPLAASPPPSGSDQKAEGQPGNRDLQNQQQALGGRLDGLRKRLRDLGLKGEKGLDDAEQAMKEAEGALAQGEAGNRRAVEAQGRALEGLQKGANGIAQQMAERQGDQPGGRGQARQGQGQGQEGARGTDAGDTDPLGRKRGRGGMETRGPEIGESVAQRAQRVLQELRRRLGDPSRPQEEQDYLERLLKRY